MDFGDVLPSPSLGSPSVCLFILLSCIFLFRFYVCLHFQFALVTCVCFGFTFHFINFCVVFGVFFGFIFHGVFMSPPSSGSEIILCKLTQPHVKSYLFCFSPVGIIKSNVIIRPPCLLSPHFILVTHSNLEYLSLESVV